MTIIAAIAATAADLFLKNAIDNCPDDHFPVSAAGENISIEKFRNYGFSLGKGKERPALVTALVTGIYTLCVGIFAPGIFSSRRQLSRLSLSLILGGGFSNLTDRLTKGYVVDYIRFPRSPFRHLIMNIGDLCLFLGTVLLAVDTMLRGEK